MECLFVRRLLGESMLRNLASPSKYWKTSYMSELVIKQEIGCSVESTLPNLIFDCATQIPNDLHQKFPNFILMR